MWYDNMNNLGFAVYIEMTRRAPTELFAPVSEEGNGKCQEEWEVIIIC